MGGWSPLRFAVRDNDVGVASVLLQRGAVIETDALAAAIMDRNPEMVKILVILILKFLGQSDFVERCTLLTANTHRICL